MEQFFELIIENGYELLTGLAIAILTLCGKPKAAEKLKKARAKKKKKYEKKQEKLVKQLKKNAVIIEENTDDNEVKNA